MVRKVTNRILELANDGVLSWEDLALMALKYMSEDEVADMARENELFPWDEEEDD